MRHCQRHHLQYSKLPRDRLLLHQLPWHLQLWQYLVILVQEELKEMKSMLLTLVSSIGGIGNSNYQRSEDISSGPQKEDEKI